MTGASGRAAIGRRATSPSRESASGPAPRARPATGRWSRPRPNSCCGSCQRPADLRQRSLLPLCRHAARRGCRLLQRARPMAPEYRPLFDEHQRRLTPERPTAAMEMRAILPRRVGALGAMGRHRHLRSPMAARRGRRPGTNHGAEAGRAGAQGERGAYRAVVEGQTEFILRSAGRQAELRQRRRTAATWSQPRGYAGRLQRRYRHPPEQQAKIHAAWAGLDARLLSGTYELGKPLRGAASLGGMDRHGHLRADRAARRVPGDRP